MDQAGDRKRSLNKNFVMPLSQIFRQLIAHLYQPTRHEQHEILLFYLIFFVSN